MKDQPILAVLLAVMMAVTLGAVAMVWRTSDVLEKTMRSQTENNQQFLTQALEALKQQQPPSPTPQPTPAPESTPNTVDQVFHDNKTAPEDEAKINEVKSTFESLFVTYQYLLKCELAGENDYYLLNSALVHQMSSVNAPGRTQYDILTAAKGTYEELYAESPCDAANIHDMQQQFETYIEETRKNRFLM